LSFGFRALREEARRGGSARGDFFIRQGCSADLGFHAVIEDGTSIAR